MEIETRGRAAAAALNQTGVEPKGDGAEVVERPPVRTATTVGAAGWLGAIAAEVAAPLERATPTMPLRAAFTLAVGELPAPSGYAATAAAPAPSATDASPIAKASTSARALTASKAAPASKAATTSKASTTSATKTTAKELAFLDDKTLSIEEKLFRFMVLMQQKSDQELTQAMKGYEAKKAASSSSSSPSSSSASAPAPHAALAAGAAKPPSSGGGGGLLDVLGDVVGGVVKGVAGVAETAAKELGGPLLAAGVTALGAPWLAPVALQVGGTLAGAFVHEGTSALGLAGGSTSTAKASASTGAAAGGGGVATAARAVTASAASSTSATSSKAASGEEFDERVEAMKLQRLVDQQNQMFSTITNILKMMHDAQMNAIGNIR